MIDLHFAATPNGHKISIALEELGLPYTLMTYDMFDGHQHTAAYGAVNPNHKLPAIVDNDPVFGGVPHAVFESGAILMYLAEKSGRLLPVDPRQRSVAIQWLTWQVAGLGPMVGQAAHFMRYAPEPNAYAIERYTKETARLLSVLERRLGQAEYLAGEEYSIADIAVFPWAKPSFSPELHPATRRWVDQVSQRHAVIRGQSGDLATPGKYLQQRAELSPVEWSNMFGERMHNAVRL
ncbi:glutathione S-transferase N-terminal domain-containing protein [Caenimonas soli]|jgi:GST-like protein|uniref:glutathione S-transferase N-terminal domain-containing protein n=1 Tax=Caenimonas soli TaxID=2735555 RepID=UPI0015560472|nr:glutathione S-transferase N-terminal domain-containing protein [Caenimonas soli]NPC55928.1 thiol:disulfide oxidoreductase [Caenimonas soli]